jgi:hypothetical protein
LSRFAILLSKQVTDFADNNAQDSALARITLPAAISRNAMTISRLSDCMSGLAPRSSWRARFDASNTNSKRFEIFAKQSSRVIRAMRISKPQKSRVVGSTSFEPFSYTKNLSMALRTVKPCCLSDRVMIDMGFRPTQWVYF